jgi:Mg-chelatase subunit ChlD
MAVVITALMLTFVIPIVGLTIDAGVLYVIKAKLQAASDAAALAAARSLSVGMTLAEQEGTARARATAFFHANYPDGMMESKNKHINVAVAESGFRRRTVTVDADVEAPVYFMRVLGFSSTVVRASGQASRRDVNLMLVLDRSGSMDSSGSCEPMKAAATGFVDLFANGRDRLGMITFGTSHFKAYPATFNFKSNSPSLTDVIANITCTGGTSSAMALSEAQAAIAALAEPGALNLILFFTDGLPNGLTASYEIKKKTDTRYGYGADTYGSTGSTYSMLPSTCTYINTAYSATIPQKYDRDEDGNMYGAPNWNPRWTPIPNKVGVLAGTQNATAATGSTWGLYVPEATTIGAVETGIADNAGCRFASAVNPPNPLSTVRRDIAYIPNTDFYGNATNTGPWAGDLSYFSAGDYNGRLRPDRPATIGAASKNAAYNAAAAARTSAFSTTIYTIGLGDPDGSDPPDDNFMLRISNDPASPEFTDAQPEGLYVFAPNNGELAQAFYKVASEILRIAK